MVITKITEKFTDKKKKFNSYIAHPEVFDCDDFNLIKLFQYAIFREEGFKARPFWKLPTFILSIILWWKRVKIKKKQVIVRNLQVKILIGDTHRAFVNQSGKICSRYFENILLHLNRQNLLFVNTSPYYSEIKHDYSFIDFYDIFSYLPLSEDDKRILKHLKRSYKRILSSLDMDSQKIKIFEEIIQIFWQEYRAYRAFLNYFPNIEAAFIFPHYQKESLIYALRKKGIKIIELQHGLIAQEDMFYVYDKNILKVKDKALFADEMWVYGEYWKSILLQGYEYNEEQIKVFGYYVYYEKGFSKEFQEFLTKLKTKYDKIILATAQKNLEHHLSDYLNFLIKDTCQKKQNIAIVVKPHPSGTQDISTMLNNENKNVFVVNYPVEWLFQICDAHVSIYSTTLFDALMFKVKNNFAIKHPLFEDYVKSIVKQGVAIELEMNESVVEKISTSNVLTNGLFPEYFFSNVKWELLKNFSN